MRAAIRFVRLAFVLALPVFAQESRPDALKGLDPVELCAGREIAGTNALVLEHGPHRYHFASAANAALFAKDAERHAIQWGGACGRMGPRSGKGSPDRFAVHDGRIYVFASEQCRAAFLKAPEKFLDPDDPPTTSDVAARKQGAVLVEKMVAAAGGAARLDAIKTWDAVRSKTTKTKDGDRNDRVRLRTAGGRQRLDEHWGDWSWTTIVSGDDGFTIDNDGDAEAMHPSAVRDFRRERIRNPFALLCARNDPGFAAAAAPAPPGSNLAWVEIGFRGATTAIGVDPATGEFREGRHRGRGPSFWFGAVVNRYSDWKDVGGVRVPHKVEVEFDGKPVPEETRIYESIRFDVEILDSVFARPQK